MRGDEAPTFLFTEQYEQGLPDMKALTHPFQLSSTQKWHNIWFGVAAALAVFVLALIVSNMDIDGSTMGTIILIAFGLLTGITLRLGTKRGWTYYAERHQPDARYVFTKDLKLGVLWRVLVVWFGGRVVSAILLSQADSDIGMALLLLVSIVLVVAVALYVGLRFGWRSADSKLTGAIPATTSL
jgi:hypothetical protein